MIGHILGHVSRLWWLLIWKGRLGTKKGAGASGKRQLLIDVSVISRDDRRTGIQRVVRAIWDALEKESPPGWEIVPVVADDRHGYCRFDALSTGGVRRWAPVHVFRGDVFLGLDLSAKLMPRYRQQLHAWKKGGVGIHILVYDLLPLRFSRFFSKGTANRFKRWLAFVCAEADHLICISRTVANDLGVFLDKGTRPWPGKPSVSVIRLGADLGGSRPTAGRTEEDEKAIRAATESRTVIMVGTVEPRKGYDVALAALEHCWNSTAPAEWPVLVILGRAGWKTDRLQQDLRTHPMAGRTLFWLRDASDEVVEFLYRNAQLLLSASYAEGFGLPLWEAAGHGLRILARDLPEFRELDLPVADFFSCDDPERLSFEIMKLLEDQNSHKGLPSRIFTWADCTRDLLDCMGFEEGAAISVES